MRRKKGPKLKPKPTTAKEFDSDREPYERQSWETDDQWKTFCLYRDLDGSVRTVKKAAELYAIASGKGIENSLKAWETVQNWSAHGAWRTRMDAWDLELDRQRRKTVIAEHTKMAGRHAKLARGMQQLGGIGLATLLKKAEEAGKKIALSATDIKNLIALGVQIERESVGEPGAIVENRQVEMDADKKRALLSPIMQDPESKDAVRALVRKILKHERDSGK